MRIHIFLILIVAFMVASSFVRVSAQAGLFTLLFFGLLGLSVLLHEFGHCYAGARVGGQPRQILMWILGGLASIEGAPQHAGPQILIALAGPLVNLLLAAAALAMLLILDLPVLPPWDFAGFPWYGVIFKMAFLVNGVLLLFNLIPAMPLDGGAMLRWALAERVGFVAGTRAAGYIGQGLAVLMGLSALVFRGKTPLLAEDNTFFILFTAVFIFLTCEREKRTAQSMEQGTFPLWGDDEAEFISYAPPPPRQPTFFERLRTRREARRREQDVREEVEMRERVDELLDKISLSGFQSLSEKEKSFLKEASKRFGNRNRYM